MSTMRKDNSGYDLKQLFIGSEGTLGVITEVALKCPQADPAKHLVLVAVPTFANCVQLLKEARLTFRDSLSAFELMDSTCM